MDTAQERASIINPAPAAGANRPPGCPEEWPGPRWGGVMPGVVGVTEEYPAAPRPHLEPPGQPDLVPGLTE